MKKTYKNPTMTIVKIETAQMVAASVEMHGSNANSAAMGREGSFWDDEE